MSNSFVQVSTVSEIPAGQTLRIQHEQRDILLANVGGTLFACDDTCTHEDASLSCGVLDGAIVRCPLHGAKFDLRDGSPLDEPAEEPLPCHEVRVEDGDVFVRLRRE